MNQIRGTLTFNEQFYKSVTRLVPLQIRMNRCNPLQHDHLWHMWPHASSWRGHSRKNGSLVDCLKDRGCFKRRLAAFRLRSINIPSHHSKNVLRISRHDLCWICSMSKSLYRFCSRIAVSSSKIGAVHGNRTSWLLLYARPSFLRFSSSCARWRLVALSEHVG